jgi:hypothetical protein
MSMDNLAVTYYRQARWKEAEDLGLQVVEALDRVLGAEQPSTLISISNLAHTYHSQARYHEALALLERCSIARVKCIGIDHPDTQSSQQTLHKWRSTSL